MLEPADTDPADTGAVEPVWVSPTWRALLAAGVRTVASVPDAGLAALIRRAEATADVTAVPLSTEEEGVALLAGAWLGGSPGVLLMQSSGVGNCINLLSLARTCRFPLLMVVTMRGQYGERNPWQVPMGSTAAEVLRASGVLVFDVQDEADVAPTVEAAAAMVFSGAGMAAVLIGQRVIGAKAFAAAGR
ncbi:MAG: phosphonopyruvate decarboxylase [Acidimicrobiales bacterium]|nr:phosphonopyruvate decarboxylase [Acidimicrobiales bacterium]